MRIQDYRDLKEGDIVVIAAFDGWPEHLFEVDHVFDDSFSGYSNTVPLTGVYGEPWFEMILKAKRRWRSRNLGNVWGILAAPRVAQACVSVERSGEIHREDKAGCALSLCPKFPVLQGNNREIGRFWACWA